MFIDCVQEERNSYFGAIRTLTLFCNATYLVTKGQMVGRVAQGMLAQVHTYKDSFRGSAADGIY